MGSSVMTPPCFFVSGTAEWEWFRRGGACGGSVLLCVGADQGLRVGCAGLVRHGPAGVVLRGRGVRGGLWSGCGCGVLMPVGWCVG